MNTLTTHKNLVLLACLLLFTCSCAPVTPLPQPKRVIDPSSTPYSVRTDRWDIAAVSYRYMDQGLDYDNAGLDPVFLVFKNKGNEQPQVLLEEVRGVSSSGEYLVYSVDEAARLVYASESFNVNANNMLRSGGAGAAVGAGLGALIGLLSGGNDRVWQGAILGGAIGGVGGAVASMPESRRQLEAAVMQELNYYVWREDPIPAMLTRSGYLYFPDVGIRAIKITVRTDNDVASYEIPVTNAPGAYSEPVQTGGHTTY